MNAYYVGTIRCSSELFHHGIKGQKWGIRRYQNPDGSLTTAGIARYRTASQNELSERKAGDRMLLRDSAYSRRLNRKINKALKKEDKYLNKARENTGFKQEDYLYKAADQRDRIELGKAMQERYTSLPAASQRHLDKITKNSGKLKVLSIVGGPLFIAGAYAISGSAGMGREAMDLTFGKLSDWNDYKNKDKFVRFDEKRKRSKAARYYQ